MKDRVLGIVLGMLVMTSMLCLTLGIVSMVTFIMDNMDGCVR